MPYIPQSFECESAERRLKRARAGCLVSGHVALRKAHDTAGVSSSRAEHSRIMERLATSIRFTRDENPLGADRSPCIRVMCMNKPSGSTGQRVGDAALRFAASAP